MATSLRFVMATLPSGVIPHELSLDQLSSHLREHWFTQDERDRQDRHRLRDELYRDGGVEEMKKLIDTVYTDPVIREKRKQWARWARFDNVTKRIVKELSTVYQEPAVRKVGGDEANQTRYQLALALCKMHQRSQHWHRMLNLHRAIVVGARVRMTTPADGRSAPSDRVPIIDVVTPANAMLFTHPNDCHHIVAVAIRIRPKRGDVKVTDRIVTETKPGWRVWSAAEQFLMREDGTIVGDSFQPHTLGRIPYVFVSLEPPSDTNPWPGMAGEDIIAADMAVWFSAVNLLKEVKSATRQSIVSGNVDAAARDQAADTEAPIEIPDGVAITSQDMSMDLSLFRDTANHVTEHVANNYGMSGAMLRHQGVQSADAREIMRVPLRELRLEQEVVLRPFEQDLAETMAVVLRHDMAEIAFDSADFVVDFGEAQTPLSSKEELERFEHERKIGLTSTIAYVMKRNPDMDEAMARAFVEKNVQDELWRNRAMRPLQAISGSMGAKTPGTENPQSGVSPDEQAEEQPRRQELAS